MAPAGLILVVAAILAGAGLGWRRTSGGYLLPVLASVFVGGTPTWGGIGTVFGGAIGAPAGDIDDQIMTSLSRQPAAVCTQREPTGFGAQLMAPAISRHGSTVGHM